MQALSLVGILKLKPLAAALVRAKHVGILSEESYKFSTSQETIDLINQLYEKRSELDDVLRYEIQEAKTSIEKLKKVPMHEFVEYMSLLAQSENIWAKAKNNNDWASFEPILEKIVAFLRKYIVYIETPKLKGYDVCRWIRKRNDNERIW